MVKDHLSRKLTVILHADVVGSTRLVQQNETLAHERIQAAFHHFSASISTYGGITRELRGDALLAEFDRASDAVASALAFQELNTKVNATLDDAIRPLLRIGISLGEVIIADNTITGAGVVLAQRLEQLAAPGGLVVLGSVADTVPTRLPFDFKSLGEQKLKGFDQPVRAFTVSLRPGEDLLEPEADAAPQTEDLIDIQVPSKLSPESYEALTGERLVLPDKPSIAVLPFHNMSCDPEQEYFADGMSEDLITALSRVHDLVVIARNSTFVYKERAVDVRQVGSDLAVSHVLEGSIRKAGDRLRITAQLVETQSGDHIWAEHYDRKIDDIFAIQDEITQNIVIELSVKLVTGKITRLMATGTRNIEAWELTRRSGYLLISQVRDNLMLAKQLLGRALALDENYSAAWENLGWAYYEESSRKWGPDPEALMQKAFEAAHKALSADPDYPGSYSLLGHIYMTRGDKTQAISMSEKALELAPGDPYRMALLADILIDTGRVNEGIRNLQKAIRLCPFPPAWFLFLLGRGFHINGDNEVAIFALEQSIEREPGSHVPRLWLTSALIEMGRHEEANAVSRVALSIEPNFSTASWASKFSSQSHARLKDNLLAAGFPE
jgi:adenylate cyclase